MLYVEFGQDNKSGTVKDYMFKWLFNHNHLFAELPAVPNDEEANYQALRQEIIRQAREVGINPRYLVFKHDFRDNVDKFKEFGGEE